MEELRELFKGIPLEEIKKFNPEVYKLLSNSSYIKGDE